MVNAAVNPLLQLLLKGQDGRDGEPGEPGVHLWTVPNIAHTNGVLLNESGFILIPPDILGTTSEMQVVRVQEGSHLKLSCFATGIPEPSVVWSGVNDQPFTQGVWQSEQENREICRHNVLYEADCFVQESHCKSHRELRKWGNA